MKLLLKSLLASAVLLASTAEAGQLVDVTVVDRHTGQVLTEYGANGKNYVAGMPGHRYAVRMRNNSSERILAVLSVDGVNAISGATASPSQSGYVLGPWESTEIAGWRKDMSQIAAFEFTRLSDSYAARTGRPQNVGVIGVAVFREYRAPIAYRHDDHDELAKSAESASGTGQYGARDAAEPMPSAPAGAPPSVSSQARRNVAGQDRGLARSEEKLGTGHGQRESSYATYTQFVRESNAPFEVVSVFYDSLRNLQARGIVPAPYPPRYDEPNAFPVGFVPDP